MAASRTEQLRRHEQRTAESVCLYLNLGAAVVMNILAGNKPSASLAAEKLIDYYGIRCAADIRLEEIAMDRGVFVHRGPLSGMDGFLLRQGGRGFVRVNACEMLA